MEAMIMSRRPSFHGRPATEQAGQPAKARPDRATREAMKEQRDRDAALAMKEYEAERRAVLANTERLRALRLARESGPAPAKAAKAAKKGS
jgi:hypothetical protein